MKILLYHRLARKPAVVIAVVISDLPYVRLICHDTVRVVKWLHEGTRDVNRQYYFVFGCCHGFSMFPLYKEE